VLADSATPVVVGERQIDREEIRRFSVAIGARDPVHTDVHAAVQAGFRDVVAPTAFFAALGLSMGRVVPVSDLREDGIVATEPVGARIVGGETSFVYHGPVLAGDFVTVTRRFIESYKKQGKTGPLEFYVSERQYLVDGTPRATEVYSRVSRQ
jgi:acyl dehydratase